ncbi:hypothetical protein [Candidatus Nitrospira salsa]
MKVSPKSPEGTAFSQELSEARCECGQLVAKLGSQGVELKCKRCKRLVSISFSDLADSEVTVQLCSAPPTLQTPL